MSRFAVAVSLFVLTLSISGLTGTVLADQRGSEAVFGQSLMSTAEVTAHKERIARCRSAQERADVENEHKNRMVQRARWKGMVLDRDARTVTLADNN